MYAVAEPWPLEAVKAPRDDHWLSLQLDRIWDTFFRDIPRINSTNITFARHWKARLGLITLAVDTNTTYIGINAFLRYDDVPEFVNTTTIAHELAHYAHGFGSPLPRRYAHPHRGGVVSKELAARGLGVEHRAHLQWVRDHWHECCASRHRLRPVR